MSAGYMSKKSAKKQERCWHVSIIGSSSSLRTIETQWTINLLGLIRILSAIMTIITSWRCWHLASRPNMPWVTCQCSNYTTVWYLKWSPWYRAVLNAIRSASSQGSMTRLSPMYSSTEWQYIRISLQLNKITNVSQIVMTSSKMSLTSLTGM